MFVVDETDTRHAVSIWWDTGEDDSKFADIPLTAPLDNDKIDQALSSLPMRLAGPDGQNPRRDPSSDR